MTGPGWREFFADKGEPFDDYFSAAAFRNRHFSDYMQAMTNLLTRRR